VCYGIILNLPISFHFISPLSHYHTTVLLQSTTGEGEEEEEDQGHQVQEQGDRRARADRRDAAQLEEFRGKGNPP
jgi:hypothetical protein